MTEHETIERIKDHMKIHRLEEQRAIYLTDAFAIAIQCIEKQIPKEPIPQDEDCLECPNCDSFIGYASECKDEHYRVEYCPNCGQAIKWE